MEKPPDEATEPSEASGVTVGAKTGNEAVGAPHGVSAADSFPDIDMNRLLPEERAELEATQCRPHLGAWYQEARTA
jgi:hypothetical protein